MKPLIIFFSFLIVFYSCKQNVKKESAALEKELTTAQNIANAHGIQHWKEVTQIKFTFNTSRGERSWTWEPKTQNVILINQGDTVSYNRFKIDSTSLQADRAFINDKYWFLAPFQLVWDKDATISEAAIEAAPISKTEMNKLTITYPPNGGGYTPGDAYDFYFGDDFIIKEWVYRKGNQAEPSMMTTWEDYQDFSGIKVATMHRKAEDNWKLWFTGISVTTE